MAVEPIASVITIAYVLGVNPVIAVAVIAVPVIAVGVPAFNV